jgi:transcriptional regulator with XRE-family HTH domain
MKLGDVLRKERERKKVTAADAAMTLGLPIEDYEKFERGASPIEEWGPRLAQLAINLSAPTSRLISETGRSSHARRRDGQCGQLIRAHRMRKQLSQEELAAKLNWPLDRLTLVESGESPLEIYAPLLLRFAELIDQPIFNLFYPCGLPLEKLDDYRSY